LHKEWRVLASDHDHVLKHGLFGSQQVVPAQRGLGNREQEIAFVCGLMELDNFTLPTAPGFIKKVTEAQGEFRQNEALFDAAYRIFERRFEVTLQSQIDKGLVDPDVIGCIQPGGPINEDPQGPRRDTKGQLRQPNEGEQWVPLPADPVNVLSARSIA